MYHYISYLQFSSPHQQARLNDLFAIPVEQFLPHNKISGVGYIFKGDE